MTTRSLKYKDLVYKFCKKEIEDEIVAIELSFSRTKVE